jgi:predicted NAD/FAD-dependent oxidoreductase
VRLSENVWMNYGAQYITEDRPKVVDLADTMKVPIQRSENFEDYWERFLPANRDERTEAESGVERIEDAQSRPVSLTLPEMDDTTFADWLGPMSTGAAAFFDEVMQLMNCASTVELSVAGGLWVWGDQRTSPFNTPDIPHHDRGECIVTGGTSEIAQAVARAVGRVSLNTAVRSVRSDGDGYTIEADDVEGRRVIHARRVVCALPAPVALEVIADLPGWKRDALRSVTYGSWISTPIVVGPASEPRRPYPLVASRPGVRYNADTFLSRTPADLDENGGCYHSFMSDSQARQVWLDPDESVKSGAVREFLARLPEYEGRIRSVGIHRWRHGLPQYRVGRMKQYHLLPLPVDGVHFCGDYTIQSNMEGAVASGESVAAEVAASIRA